MNKRNISRSIAAAGLIAYIVFLVLYHTYINRTGFETTYFEIVRFYNDDILWEYWKEAFFKVLSFMPVGFLFPLARGRRCKDTTVSVGILLSFGLCVLFAVLKTGTVSIDGFLFRVIGACLGYSVFKKLAISKNIFKKLILYFPDTNKKRWAFLLMLSAFVITFMIGYHDPISIMIDSDSHDISFGRSLSDFTILSNDHDEAELYNIIRENIKGYKTSIAIRGNSIDHDLFTEVFNDVLDDCPDVFWLNGGGMGTTAKSLLYTEYVFDPVVYGKISDAPKMHDELMEKVDEIISACPYTDDYERALWVHDYLVKKVEYDYGTYYTSADATGMLEGYNYSYSSYGAIIEGLAVCAGYAKAYQLILNEMGIECGLVTGTGITSTGGGAHAWNYVVTDNVRHYVDVTWDDPKYMDGLEHEISHDYFFLSLNEIGKDHIPD